MFDKFSSENDDFLAQFGFGPGSTAVQAPEYEPESEEPVSSEPLSSIPSAFMEPVQAPAAPAPAAPAPKVVPQQVFDDVVEEEPAPQAQRRPQSQIFDDAVPSWYNPAWQLPKARSNEDEPEMVFDDLVKGFEEVEPFEFPSKPKPRKPRAKAQPKAAPEPVESEPETVEFLSEDLEPVTEEPEPQAGHDLSDFDAAKDYLMSFEGKSPAFDTVIDAIIEVTNILALSKQNRSQKQVANALGFVMGSIESLIKNPYTLGDDKDKIVQAARTVNEFYSKQVVTLNPDYQEMVNNQIDLQVQGPKPRPLQRRSSAWHGENIIFTRNRAIDILRNEENVTVTQAEEQAQDEWNGIVEIIQDKAKNFSPGDKATFQSMFAKAILGGDTFETAAQYIEGLIDRGPDQSDTFYDDIDTDVDDDEILQTLDNMSDEGSVDEEIEDIPDEDVRAKLKPLIIEFAQSAHKLLKEGMHWEGREPPPEVMDVAQELYQHVISLSSKISSTPQDLKEKAFDNGNIFKDIYIATSKVNDYTATFGIENVDAPNVTGAELAEMGNMTISDPTKKKFTDEDKALQGPQKKRIRNPEVEKAAHERYMDLIRHHGRLADYYNQRRQRSAMKEPALRGRGEERRMETEEEFAARRDPAKEKVRLTKKDATLVNSEADSWKRAGLNKKNQRSTIATLRTRNLENMMKFWRGTIRSWLPKETLDPIVTRRFDDRVQKLTAALDHLKSYPLQVNPEVVDALEDIIQKLPEAWSSTKEKVEIESLRSSRVFRPGEWTEWDQESRRGVSESQRKGIQPAKRRKSKLSSAILYSDIFYRFASSEEWLTS